MNRWQRRHPFKDPGLRRLAEIAYDLDASMMGQAEQPISASTTILDQQNSQTASAGGTATFKFTPPPAGQTATGTVCCPGAPSDAVFTATIGATQWGDWAGNSTGGPIQALATQVLTVTATGLTPGVDYLLTWIGSVDASQNVQPVYPDPNASAVVLAGLIATSGRVDYLGTVTQTGGASTALTGYVASEAAYTSLAVVALSTAAPICVQVADDTLYASTAGSVPNFVAPFSPPSPAFGIGASGLQAIVPVANGAGDELQITVYYDAASTEQQFWVFGLTNGPVPLMRADGRAFPLGSFRVSASTAAGAAGQLLGAPLIPNVRYILSTLSLSANGGAGAAAQASRSSRSAVCTGTTGRLPCGALHRRIPPAWRPGGVALDGRSTGRCHPVRSEADENCRRDRPSPRRSSEHGGPLNDHNFMRQRLS